MKYLVAFVALVAVALAAPINHVTFEEPTLPSHIIESNKIADGQMTITLVLKQQNMNKLKKIALAVSDPKSPRYGKFLSSDEIARLTAPKPVHFKTVVSWLQENGLTYEQRNENLFVSMSVQQASALFSTQIRSVFDSSNNKDLLRASDFSIPNHIAEALHTVIGLHGLPAPKQEYLSVSAPVPVTPAVIKSTYSVSNVTVNRQGSNIQAVAEFQDQFMNKNDLVDFFKNEVPSAQTGDDQVSKFVGYPYTPGSSVEAALDIQFIMGVAVGVKTQFWEWPHNDFCGDLVNYTSYMLSINDPPLVNSISYGWQGNLNQVGCTNDDVSAVDANWAKLAAKGISILIASGDSGSGYKAGLRAELYPSWPASSPWVTAVGATAFTGSAGSEEEASTQFGSGGGFFASINQDNATWQQDVVAAYVKKGSTLDKFPPSDAFDAHGRATPDVSGLGEGYQVYVEKRVAPVGGTSASTPMFAGLVSLINEARLAKGMSVMGFLNPFLYQNPDAFFDVVKGTNAIARDGLPSKYGYAATEGWDAATGLGTPHFDKLLQAALSSGRKTQQFKEMRVSKEALHNNNEIKQMRISKEALIKPIKEMHVTLNN